MHFPPAWLDWTLQRFMPLIAVGTLLVGVRWFLRSGVGSALTERMRGVGPGESEEVAALKAQVSELQGQIAEVGERLDFAERLLAKRDVERVAPPR